MSGETYKARSVKIVGDDTLVLRRDRGLGTNEVQQLVVIDTNTLQVLKTCTSKDELNEFLEDREWSTRLLAREARKQAKAGIDDQDDDGSDDTESGQAPQQPPV